MSFWSYTTIEVTILRPLTNSFRSVRRQNIFGVYFTDRFTGMPWLQHCRPRNIATPGIHVLKIPNDINEPHTLPPPFRPNQFGSKFISKVHYAIRYTHIKHTHTTHIHNKLSLFFIFSSLLELFYQHLFTFNLFNYY